MALHGDGWAVVTPASSSPATSTTINVGTVTSLPPGTPATVTNGGTATAAVFNFGIPQGAAGAPGANGPPMTFTGAYNPATTYLAGQGVSYTDGQSYVSLVSGNTANAPPSSPTQWGLLAAKGAGGGASLAQLANMQAATSPTAAYGPNLIVQSTLKPGYGTGGTNLTYFAVNSNYTAIPPIFIGGSTFTTTCQFDAHDAYNVYFLDANLNTITGETITSGGIPAGTYTPPADAAYIAGFVNVLVTNSSADAATPCNTATWQLVHGSTLPPFAAGDVYPTNVVDSKIATIAAVAVSNGQLDARMPINQNLLDPARLTPNTAIHYDVPGVNPVISAGSNGFQLAGLIPVKGYPYVCSNKPLFDNSGYGPEFLDSSGSPLPMASDLLGYWTAAVSIPANTCLTVPPTANFFRPFLNDTSNGSGNNGPQGIACWMIVTSSTSTATFPPTCQPFVGTPVNVDPIARAAAQPMAGQNGGWDGDSISAGQGSGLLLSPLVTAITGANDTFSLSWAGRYMYDALDNVGNTSVAYPTQTTIQSLKYFVLWLGTNLADPNHIGTITDAASVGASNANGITFPSTDSYIAQLKGVVTQLLAWNPTLRIFLVTPYQNANQNANAGCTPYGAGVLPCSAGLAVVQNTVAADKLVGQFYSIPVIDAYALSGIGPLNNTTVTVDGTHPTTSTQTNIIAPFLAHQLNTYAWR